MINFIDPTAVIGPGTRVWHFAVVLSEVVIGRDCSIGSRAEIGRGTVIGDRSRLGSGVFLPPNSFVGPDVFIGPGVICCDDRVPRVPQPGDPPYHAEPPRIDARASIGAGAVLLPGVRIGAGAMIGAGAIVTRDVEPGMVVRGEPARARHLVGV